VLKRAGIISVIIFATVLAVAGYLIQKNKKVVVIDPWLAVPSDAVFIVETHDFPELLTKVTDRNGIITRLAGMKWASVLSEAAATVDSITGSRDLREMMNNRKVILSFHAGGQGYVTPMAVLNSGPSFNFRDLAKMVSRSGATASAPKELAGGKVLSATFGKGNNQKVLYIALSSGIIILSPSETLVANALNNKSTGSDIRHQQGFSPVANASGKEAENLYILFRNLPRLAQSFVNPAFVTPLSAAAIAAGGDITPREDGLFISGFMSTAGAGLGVDRLNGVIPAESGVHEVLPERTLSYRTIMKRPSMTGQAAADPEGINATDLALAVSPFTGAEVTIAVIPTETGRVKVILFRMDDRQAAEAILKEKLTAKYRSMGLRESQFIAALREKGEEQVVIYKMPFAGVASMLSGEPAGTMEDNWVLFCRSYMIFAATPEVLVEIQNGSDEDNTLINDLEFREMEKTLPTKSSFLLYISGGAIKAALDQYLTPAAAATLTDNTFSGIQALGLSLSPSNDMIYTSLSVRYRDPSLARPEVTTTSAGITGQDAALSPDAFPEMKWKVKLQANLGAKPFFFTNHNTGATEIFVQDQQNNIYLISSGGRILWKALIRERILGDVFMIDYYKNGKNQLLFAGRDYLHLIDRNGKYVDRFPVKLRSPASNTLALYDYDGNREYRLLIAGTDRKIYLYDRSGAQVRGWNLFVTKGTVRDQVGFYRVRGKDYLVVADEQAVYCLDRTGNPRLNIKEPVIKAAGSVIRLAPGAEPSVVCTSPDGTVRSISFDGTVGKRQAVKFSQSHRSDFCDLDGDGINELLVIDQGALNVYKNDSTVLFTKSFETKDIRGPYLYNFSASDRRVGAYETGKQLIYIFNRNGDPAPGFPIKGGEFFAAGKLSSSGGWNLVSDGTDGYLYNRVLDTVLK
jgi:hypothetical protein